MDIKSSITVIILVEQVTQQLILLAKLVLKTHMVGDLKTHPITTMSLLIVHLQFESIRWFQAAIQNIMLLITGATVHHGEWA